MEKKILFLAGVLVLALTLIVSVAVLAVDDNVATQSATTSKAETILVVAKTADTAIDTITFPAGLPGATISVPYNDIDLVTDAQVLSGSASEPVVKLKNTSAGDLNVWLGITTWNATDALVASEDYELVLTSDTTVAVVNNALSADGGAANVDTYTQDSVPAITASGGYMALYLELVLGAEAGKTGTSTLTVLGETP